MKCPGCEKRVSVKVAKEIAQDIVRQRHAIDAGAQHDICLEHCGQYVSEEAEETMMAWYQNA